MAGLELVGPPRLDLSVEAAHAAPLRVNIDNSAWSVAGRAGKYWTSLRWQAVPITGLSSDRHYAVRLLQRDDDHELAVGAFDTLPVKLAKERLGTITSDSDPLGTVTSDESMVQERVFTVFLGSCYWAADDAFNTVADRYERLYRSSPHRPHLKLLVGDQVYLDQPPGEWRKRKSTRELQRFLTGRYHAHWMRLRGLLSRGGTICIADDHEFWNDYPYAPVAVAWPALQKKSYRSTVAREAGALFDAIQLGRATTHIDIGQDLSLFVADTRINRSADETSFMRPADFDQLRGWIAGLQSPGVLVIGQPVFTGAYGHATGYDYPEAVTGFRTPVSNIRTDHNLPAFTQYVALAKRLRQ